MGETLTKHGVGGAEEFNRAPSDRTLHQTFAIVDQVMDTLNSTNSGTIKKKEFERALLSFNDDNQAGLDVDSIVKDVFKNKPALDRSIIREEMNLNQEIQEVVAAEPIQD